MFNSDPSHRKNFNRNKQETSEDLRRKRNDLSVQLRKARRDEQLSSKRKNLDGKIIEYESLQWNSVNNTDVKELDRLKIDIAFGGNIDKFVAVQKTRRLLSRTQEPVIQEIISCGMVPLLVNCLDDTENPELQFEAAWGLTNIASGTPDQTYSVVEAGAIPKFALLLKSQHFHVVEQVVWALGNIAGDGPASRDVLLSHNILPDLLNLIKPQSPVMFLKNVVFALANLCRNVCTSPFADEFDQCLPYFSKILYHSDVNILSDCCWALTFLSRGSIDAVQRTVDQGIVPRLVQLIASDNQSVVIPSLNIIGNIVSGTKEHVDVVLNANCLQILKLLLRNPYTMNAGEAMRILANIASGKVEHIQALIQSGLMKSAKDVLKWGTFKSQKEACLMMSNFAHNCDINQFSVLMNTDIIGPLCTLMNGKDSNVIYCVLDALTRILQISKKMNKHECVVLLIEENDGRRKLDELVQRNENLIIYDKASYLIDNYFTKDMVADTSAVPNDGNHRPTTIDFQNPEHNVDSPSFNFQ